MNHLWSRKRIGFTAVSVFYAIALCFLLVKMLEAGEVWWPVIVLVTVSVAIVMTRMIYGLGEAAEKMELDHRHHLPQNWTRPVREPGCDLCPEPEQFVHCRTHDLYMCWQCTNRHIVGRPDCVLIPVGAAMPAPRLVKKS